MSPENDEGGKPFSLPSEDRAGLIVALIVIGFFVAGVVFFLILLVLGDY